MKASTIRRRNKFQPIIRIGDHVTVTMNTFYHYPSSAINHAKNLINDINFGR